MAHCNHQFKLALSVRYFSIAMMKHMSKAAYRRVYGGLFIVSEGESTIVMVGNKAAVRYGTAELTSDP